MNLSENPTITELTSLLSKYDDDAGTHILWVADYGEVEIMELTNQTVEDFDNSFSFRYQFRFEAFRPGTNSVGVEAVENELWVRRLFNGLKRHWENQSTGIIDMF